jgi:hypothetical protein
MTVACPKDEPLLIVPIVLYTTNGTAAVGEAVGRLVGVAVGTEVPEVGAAVGEPDVGAAVGTEVPEVGAAVGTDVPKVGAAVGEDVSGVEEKISTLPETGAPAINNWSESAWLRDKATEAPIATPVVVTVSASKYWDPTLKYTDTEP